MPCTSEAVRHFEEKGVVFGPAKAANAGEPRRWCCLVLAVMSCSQTLARLLSLV